MLLFLSTIVLLTTGAGPVPNKDVRLVDHKEKGFEVLFDGHDLNKWTSNTSEYVILNKAIVFQPKMNKTGAGYLYTKKEYSDFIFLFEFQLTPGANNGLGIRVPLTDNAAYDGMELQILDNEAEIYRDLQPYQYHGSVYGVIPARRGFLKPTGEWNVEEVIAKGDMIQVILNGTMIMNGDISEARKHGTMDHRSHPGLSRDSGHIGFVGHGSEVRFRNIRVKDLNKFGSHRY